MLSVSQAWTQQQDMHSKEGEMSKELDKLESCRVAEQAHKAQLENERIALDALVHKAATHARRHIIASLVPMPMASDRSPR